MSSSSAVLPQYQTGTGFDITPVVGLVTPPFELQLDPFEVAEVFEVPLAFLLDTSNHQLHSAIIRGARREYYAMPYGEYFIWVCDGGNARKPAALRLPVSRAFVLSRFDGILRHSRMAWIHWAPRAPAA